MSYTKDHIITCPGCSCDMSIYCNVQELQMSGTCTECGYSVSTEHYQECLDGLNDLRECIDQEILTELPKDAKERLEIQEKNNLEKAIELVRKKNNGRY